MVFHLKIFFLLQHVFFLKTYSTLISATLSPNQSFFDGDVLLSAGKRFALGFFSPGNVTRRYLGIWYYQVSEPTIVWVANRNKPLKNTLGVVVFHSTGNLIVTSKKYLTGNPFWSTNLSENTSLVEAKLLDTGNLVIVEESTGNFLWQSFDYPTDTLMPFMKLGLDRRTGLNRFLTSWKSKDDPGIGSCIYRINPTGTPQLFIYKGPSPWWRAGPWNGLRWSGVPEMNKNYIFNVTYVDNPSELSIMYGILNPSIDSRMILEGDSCTVQRVTWHESDKRWTGFWSAPKDSCDMYNRCGNYGYCDQNKNPGEFECNCLPGFRPKSNQDWFLRDGSDGCVREKGPKSACGRGEGFLKMERIKVPDTSMVRVDMRINIDVCGKMCAGNCSCVAYTSANVSGAGSGCLAWYHDLVDMEVYSDVGQDLFVRVDSVTLGKSRKRSKGLYGAKRILVIIAPIVFIVLLMVMILICLYKKLDHLGGKIIAQLRNARWRSHLSLLGLAPDEKEGDDRKINLPFYSLREIKDATKNFSNTLGKGGFGIVYKGNFPNDQEIAVKRLSKNSGQGAKEFKNEVLLIAKLQHRNLVKILGCCIDGDETMLIYEYMPNKGLDAFLFDQSMKTSLDWKTRYEIILGIARGILYLHQDSRLRVVHRDLKASNILLDKDMNPKISDFGMARIFGGNQTQANTNRVVGTFGYMSPEYALDGLFSMKSDVFSYGVLLLEIISGKKNLALYSDDPFSNLIKYIWNLWEQGRALEIVDERLGGYWSECEVLRCLHVGLLCVQDSATDRPAMPAVGFMLTNDTSLPAPKQPMFAVRRGRDTDASCSTSSCSRNEITLSSILPR